jgi:thiosulfate/3-mercaptopyruvate sulfurtransferase
MAWLAAGGPVAVGPGAARPPATFTPTPWPADRLATADDTAALAGGGGSVLDARAAERFTGEVALIDPRPGHVPGACSAPWASVLGADGRFRSPDDLRAHFAALGADGPTIAYCGSGVSACMNILAMERAGLTPPRLYVASWSGWAADPRRPAELGPAAPRPATEARPNG